MSHLNFINLLIPASSHLSIKEGLQAIPFFNEKEDKLIIQEERLLGVCGEKEPIAKAEEVFIFCDGSKIQIDNNAPCSALAYVVCDKSGHILYKYCAYTKKHYNYEAQSILKALHWCSEQKIKEVSIYSDSATDIWHLKNYNTPKYQHKINVYEEVIKNPQQHSRPKRWRGSEQVNILVEKSKIVEKALRLASNFEKISFGYIPRNYNSYANDMAKNLTKDYLNRVGVFVEHIPNVMILDDFETKDMDFKKINFVSYRAHHSVFFSQEGRLTNLAEYFTQKNIALLKNSKNCNYDISSLVKEYGFILEHLHTQKVKIIQIFDGTLRALLNGHINIASIKKDAEKYKYYELFRQSLAKFEKVYVSHNFSNYDKHHKKTLSL